MLDSLFFTPLFLFISDKRSNWHHPTSLCFWSSFYKLGAFSLFFSRKLHTHPHRLKDQTLMQCLVGWVNKEKFVHGSQYGNTHPHFREKGRFYIVAVGLKKTKTKLKKKKKPSFCFVVIFKRSIVVLVLESYSFFKSPHDAELSCVGPLMADANYCLLKLPIVVVLVRRRKKKRQFVEL